MPRSTDVGSQAATSKVECMLVAAGTVGIDLDKLAQVHHRLTSHEHERFRTPPSPRRVELDATIEVELETLCQAFIKLERAVEQAGASER